jgi:hypothetical protein
MTEAAATTAATASHETTGVARPAAQVRSLRLATVDVGAQEISYASPPTVPAALGEEIAWRIGIREPTDEELLQGLRELMAEDERELGPIPDDAKAEVERQWRD